MTAFPPPSSAPLRNFPEWLSDVALPSAKRHRLLRELGRWVWRQQEKKTALPASAYWIAVQSGNTAESEWQFTVLRTNPASPDRKEGGVAPATECRAASPGGPLDRLRAGTTSPPCLYAGLVKQVLIPARRKPSEQLRSLARSLAYTPLSAGDLLRFLNGYLDQVGASVPEQRTLISVEYPWLERWLSALKGQRLSAMPWPVDCPKPAGLVFHVRSSTNPQGPIRQQEEFYRVDIPLSADWQTLAPPTAEAAGRLDKPGLPVDRVRQRLHGLVPSDPTGTVFAKWYVNGSQTLLQSAHDELTTLYRLIQAGIPAAEPLAAKSVQSAIPPQRWSVFLTRGIPGEALDRWILAGANPATLPIHQAGLQKEFTAPHAASQATAEGELLTPHQHHQLARHLGLLFGHLHAAGTYHRDAYLCHVFVSRNPDGQLALRLIDLARALYRPWWPKRWAIKDLAALYYSSLSLPGITRTDRLRVLYFYLLGSNENNFGREEIRWWISCILAKAARIARHDRRRRLHVR